MSKTMLVYESENALESFSTIEQTLHFMVYWPHNTKASNISITSNRRMSIMLFTNATIVTMNPTRDIITDGAIAINDNRIAAIGKSDILLSRFHDEEVIDVKG